MTLYGKTELISLNQSDKNFKRTAVDFLFYLAGAVCYALAVNIFLAPNNILLGGFTGVATILNYLFGTPIGTVVFILNIPLFIAAYIKFGPRFILRTVFATLLVSVLIDVTAVFLPAYEGDRLLSALFAGILSGAGLGLVFLHGATTGGTDILSKLLRLKFPQMSMGRVVLILDLIVIGVSFSVYRSLENVLYSLVVIYVSAQTIDLVLAGLSHDKLMFIITDSGSEAAREITETLDRGVSVIPVTGGYTGAQHSMLFCAARASDVARVTASVRAADEKAFVVICETSDISGEGFRRRET